MNGAIMPLSREMQRLRAEHAALVTLARIILDMVRAPHPPPPAELAAARGKLRENLVGHLKCDDWILYPRRMATGVQELMGVTREREIEMGARRAECNAYNDNWTGERGAASRESVVQ